MRHRESIDIVAEFHQLSFDLLESVPSPFVVRRFVGDGFQPLPDRRELFSGLGFVGDGPRRIDRVPGIGQSRIHVDTYGSRTERALAGPHAAVQLLSWPVFGLPARRPVYSFRHRSDVSSGKTLQS
ncbi:hypothetical protein BRD06_08145 [Halobacteriales archaeon QS_9_67_15]|nr:MAG: hypothetical protein BRD06_08145 [Halobacteriales archaeon QS_9_67_15]